MCVIEADIIFSLNCKRPKYKGVLSGRYFPQHRFRGVDSLIGGMHCYNEENVLYYPGTVIRALIIVPGWDDIKDIVHIGDCFLICEAYRKVGAGKILDIQR